MATKAQNVFVSHVHEDDGRIAELKDLLASKGFTLRDYSITKDKPNEGKNPDYIKAEILAPRIRACSSMIVLVTPGTASSDWVTWEIEYAHRNEIPVIGVWAHGVAGCQLPDALREYGDAVVGWNTDKILDALGGNYGPWEDCRGAPLGLTSIKRFRC